MPNIVDAARLRALREHKGWSQRALAKQARVDASVISRLERGTQDNIRATVLIALARALDSSVDALLVDSPRLPDLDPALAPEMIAALGRISRLSSAQQRQVAALLETYASTLPA